VIITVLLGLIALTLAFYIYDSVRHHR